MALLFEFVCTLPNGLHARPASMLEDVARRFPAGITLTNGRTGRTANLKSVLAIVGTDTRLNDPCRVAIDGELASEALAAVTALVRDRLPACELVAPRVDSTAGQLLPLSPVLRDAGARIVRGVPGVPGIATGQIVRHSSADVAIDLLTVDVEDIAAEEARLEDALGAAVDAYDRALANPLVRTEAEIVKVHRAIARDPEFQALLRANVREFGCAAAGALINVERHFSGMLVSSGEARLEERALDVRDVCQHLLRRIYDGSSPRTATPLVRRSILLADRLTPGELLELDRKHLAGIALAQGGPTSHTVILAGSFGIPTLLGVTALHDPALKGDAILDAESGALVVRLTAAARRYYVTESRRIAAHSEKIRQFVHSPGRTRDGVSLQVHANIVDAAEAGAAIASGAEGIGLFRTEALFLDRQDPPSEDEQYAAFALALAEARNRPVVFRTLDVGGDKHIACLDLPKEDSPFAGLRGAAAYPSIEPIIRSHVRALLRASPRGSPKILIPMISEMAHVRWVKRVIAEEYAALCAQGTAARMPPLGAMIEVPAAIALMDDLCAEFDFFSIGSNDLLQYFTEVDRARVATRALHDPLEPDFLALLKRAIDTAHRHGRPVGLCGEMAADSRLLALFVGLQLDAVSMSPPAIPRVKAILPRLSSHDCSALCARALQSETAGDVQALLARKGGPETGALIDPHLVVIDADVTTKAEALKAICDQLFLEGRTSRPRELEHAMWQRELTYSTGVGHGVAIPHCRTAALGAPALAVLKPRSPIAWESSDGEPVRLILFLGIDDGDEHKSHMRILAKLARQLMHDGFRRGLQEEQNPEVLAEVIKQVLYAEPVSRVE
jgi:multiphosphoryl transfer protein